eukprot:911794-Rhodomonas_salina.2
MRFEARGGQRARRHHDASACDKPGVWFDQATAATDQRFRVRVSTHPLEKDRDRGVGRSGQGCDEGGERELQWGSSYTVRAERLRLDPEIKQKKTHFWHKLYGDSSVFLFDFGV